MPNFILTFGFCTPSVLAMIHDLTTSTALWQQFLETLKSKEPLAYLRASLIGASHMVTGPFGPQRLLYADYTGSGRALWQIERFVLEQVLPFYANCHSQASFCGAFTTTLREQARAIVARHCHAGDEYATIFVGAGATAGLSRLPHLLGINRLAHGSNKPVVFLGPYEHHSNILPWRESGVDVICIPESDQGGPDLVALETALSAVDPVRRKIGAFSAVSNVTGIVADVDAVSDILRRHGAHVVWDYASGGPYLPIDMRSQTRWQKDAIVLSPHKFVGGPGASGVLIIRRDIISSSIPCVPGGGTVRYVSATQHDYLEQIEEREEGGTPNILGDIRAALCILVKQSIGQQTFEERHATLRQRALLCWQHNPNIVLLGNQSAKRLMPTFAFRIKDPTTGKFVHQLLVTRILSDFYGIQARGGCSCAGPYGHTLLDIGPEESLALRDIIFEQGELAKPGWTRLNLSALLSDKQVDFLITAVDRLPYKISQLTKFYLEDTQNGCFSPIENL